MCTYIWDSWQNHKDPNQPSSYWNYTDQAVQGFSGLSPVQGASVDCYLLAALSSVAWVTPSRLRNYDRITFYHTGLKKWLPMAATASEELPLHETTKEFIFGKSRIKNEIWPAVYEKMYAKFLNVPNCPNSPNNPDILNMPARSALDTLVNVTGWVGTSISTTASDFMSQISSLVSGSKICYPTIAVTKPNFADGWPGDGNLIIPKHTYSVFGTYSGIPGKTYIVLRNPFRDLMANTGIDMITSAIGWTYGDVYYGRNATVTQDLGSKTETFDLSKGLFALSLDEVKTYFDWFGYVY